MQQCWLLAWSSDTSSRKETPRRNEHHDASFGFFETQAGKGPCDRIAAVIKGIVRAAMSARIMIVLLVVKLF